MNRKVEHCVKHSVFVFATTKSKLLKKGKVKEHNFAAIPNGNKNFHQTEMWQTGY